MSSLLTHLTDDFHSRMEARRGMLAHLGLEFTDREAETLRPDIRETLLSCARCGNPEICRGWISQKRPGTPMFCRARDAFLRLQAATAAPHEPLARA